MTLNGNRIVSASLGALYIVGAYASGGVESACKTGIFIIFPLVAIWFGEALGGYIGPSWGGSITGSTPGPIVCIAGWLLLLVPLILLVIYAFNGSKS